MLTKKNHFELIRLGLEEYAERGIFSAYSDRAIAHGKYEIRFSWIYKDPVHLIYNPARDLLTVNKLFPDVEKKSMMDKSFRLYLKSRCVSELPEHRKIDTEKLQLRCQNKNNSLFLTIKVLPEYDYPYCVNRLVNLLSDIFHEFLRQPECESYLREHYGIAGE